MQDSCKHERMQCMEVWGGNVRVEKHFHMTGLDVWVSCRPHGDAVAGGDVYYLSSCASGRITRILLADVSGHGEHVSDVALGLRDLMRQNVNKVSHRRFVEAMNQQFSASNGSGSFATAVVNSFFAPTQSLSLCNAGHPSPFIFRAAKNKWATLDLSSAPDAGTDHPSDVPLGIVEEAGYREITIHLEKGDRVLCYTDAFTEARGADGEMLGIEGLLKIVVSLGEVEIHDFVSSLIDAIRALHPDNLSQDDATLVLFCANGMQTLLRDDLLAPFRLLREPTDASRVERP